MPCTYSLVCRPWIYQKFQKTFDIFMAPLVCISLTTGSKENFPCPYKWKPHLKCPKLCLKLYVYVWIGNRPLKFPLYLFFWSQFAKWSTWRFCIPSNIMISLFNKTRQLHKVSICPGSKLRFPLVLWKPEINAFITIIVARPTWFCDLILLLVPNITNTCRWMSITSGVSHFTFVYNSNSYL